MNNATQFLESLENLKRAISKARDKFPFSRTQIEIIVLLAKAGQLTTTETAKKLGLTPGAVTQTVETLVSKNLIQREADAADRRVVNLSLTADGKKLVQQIHTYRHKKLQAVLEGLTPEEIALLTTATDKLAKLIDTQTK